MHTQSLHEACQPLLSDMSSDSEDEGGGSWTPGKACDGSGGYDCAEAWALPASAAASSIGLLKRAPSPRRQLQGSGITFRSPLLLLACTLCVFVALAAAVVTFAMLPAALAPLEPDAGDRERCIREFKRCTAHMIMPTSEA